MTSACFADATMSKLLTKRISHVGVANHFWTLTLLKKRVLQYYSVCNTEDNLDPPLVYDRAYIFRIIYEPEFGAGGSVSHRIVCARIFKGSATHECK